MMWCWFRCGAGRSGARRSGRPRVGLRKGWRGPTTRAGPIAWTPWLKLCEHKACLAWCQDRPQRENAEDDGARAQNASPAAGFGRTRALGQPTAGASRGRTLFVYARPACTNIFATPKDEHAFTMCCTSHMFKENAPRKMCVGGSRSRKKSHQREPQTTGRSIERRPAAACLPAAYFEGDDFSSSSRSMQVVRT